MEASASSSAAACPPSVAGTQDYFRDVYDHLARLDAAIETLREMLQTGIRCSITLISLAEGEVTKKLAAWGALITVPTLIAGVYGMNFQHMPELGWIFGYPLAIAFMVAWTRCCTGVPEGRLALRAASGAGGRIAHRRGTVLARRHDRHDPPRSGCRPGRLQRHVIDAEIARRAAAAPRRALPARRSPSASTTCADSAGGRLPSSRCAGRARR